MAKLAPIHVKVILAALDALPDALRETGQFTEKEIATYNLARSLRDEGRYFDAIKVLAQRGMLGRLKDMADAIVRVGNKAVIKAVLEGDTALTNGRPVAWIVAYRNKERVFYGDRKQLNYIYRKEVKPYIEDLIDRGIDEDEIVVVDIIDLESRGHN